ncbi:PAB-dependent poly(A)-specific ribonuclease subunit PAN3 [Folsomia candida]|uniref:PAB-dependent poly(A)-specific ribonuclease subunit PAN3 n=1 Tax=Folsomia candida TaxID=158441 RepID=A0A226EY51_FOLCA|nr:PAB-dependent poly(A)-specific ribonuclease subunit PAN3 [Folsomia candida]
MYTSYLKILKFHLRSCKFVKCLPFEFAKNSGRIVLTRNLGRIRMFRFQCVLSVIYTGAMFVNICFGWLTLTEKFQGIVFFSLFFIACIHRWNWNLDITGIQVINSFLEFEEVVLKDNPPPQLSLGAKLMRIFIPTAGISLMGAPILQVLLLIFAPCTPPFIMSMRPDCKDLAGFSVTQLGLHLFEGWMFLHMLMAGGTWIIYVFFTGIVSLLTYFRILKGYG